MKNNTVYSSASIRGSIANRRLLFGKTEKTIIKLLTIVLLLFSSVNKSKAQTFTAGFHKEIDCVQQDKGDEGRFTLQLLPPELLPGGILNTGICEGTTWYIDWGDGDKFEYTSTKDAIWPPGYTKYTKNDSIVQITHIFKDGIEECVIRSRYTIQNPNNVILSSGEHLFILHNTDNEGDGHLEIVDVASGVADYLYVCAGEEHKITLRDNSTWNCQNPQIEGAVQEKAWINDEPRILQWFYGRTPEDENDIQNSIITGDVVVGGEHVTNVSKGWEGEEHENQETMTGLESEEIVIPETCEEGQLYSVYLKNHNKCGDEEKPFIIEVVAPPVGGSADGGGTICEGEGKEIYVKDYVGKVAWWQQKAEGETVWQKIDNSSAKEKITVTPQSSGTFEYRAVIKDEKDCCKDKYSDPVSVMVKKKPVLDSPPSDPVCNESVFTYSPDIMPKGATGTWERILPEGVRALGQASGSGDINNTLTNSTHEVKVVEYKYKLSADGCKNEQTVKVPVIPDHEIGDNHPSPVCSGSQINDGKIQLVNPDDNVNVTFTWDTPSHSPEELSGGKARKVHSSDPINDILINPTDQPGSVTYTVYPWYNYENENLCKGKPKDITFTVNPKPELKLDKKEVCSDMPVELTLAVAEGSCLANRFNVNSISVQDGLEPYPGNAVVPANNVSAGYINNDIYRNTTTSPLEVTYKVSPVSDNGCIGEPKDITVTINPLPMEYNISAPENYCENTSGVTITLEESEQGVIYQLYKDNDVENAGVTGTGAPLKWENNEEGTYKVKMARGECVRLSNEISIKAIKFQPGSVSGDQILCEGDHPDPISEIIPVNGDGEFTYQWYRSIKDKKKEDAYEAIQVARYQSYVPTLDNDKAWYYREVTATLNNNVCKQNNDTVLIQVNRVDPGELTVDGETTICEGAGAIETIKGLKWKVTAEPPSFLWFESSNGIDFSPIPESTTNSYTAKDLTNDKWYKLRVISTVGTKGCYKETNPVRISVVNFNPGKIGLDQTICDGTEPELFEVISKPDGDPMNIYRYNWEYSTDGKSYSPINLASVSESEYKYDGTLTEDTYFRREVTAIQNDKSCSKNTEPVLVDVVKLDAGVISPEKQIICENDIPALLTSEKDASGDGPFEYQWQETIDEKNFSNITGANEKDYQPKELSEDTKYRRMVKTVKKGTSCINSTDVSTVTVNNIPFAGKVSGEVSICVGETPPVKGFKVEDPVADGNITYQWQYSPDGETYVDFIGETDKMFTAEPLKEDRWYRRKVFSTLSSGSVTQTCSAISEGTIRVYVNNFEPGSISLDNKNICSGKPAPMLQSEKPPSGDGTFTYRWFKSTVSDSEGFEEIPKAESETYSSPEPLTKDTWFYRRVFSTLNGTRCYDNTKPVDVNVINMTSGSIGNEETVCRGNVPQQLKIVTSPELDGGNPSYQWMKSLDRINFQNIDNATSDTYSPEPLFEDTWYRLTVTSTLEGISCSTTTEPILKKVNNVDGGEIILNQQTICAGDNPGPFLNSREGKGDGSISYRWEYSSDGIVFYEIPSTNNKFYKPDIALDENRYYRRVTISDCNGVSCEAYSNTVKVTVNVVDAGKIGEEQIICSGDTHDPLISIDDGSGSNISYEWYRSDDYNDNDGHFISGDISLYRQDILSSDAWFWRKTISNLNGKICTASTDKVHITVNPLPDATFTVDNNSGCTPLTAKFSNDMTNIASWEWDFDDDGEKADNANPQHTFENTGDNTKYYNVTLKVVSNDQCRAESNRTIEVYPVVKSSFTASPDAVCSGDVIEFSSLTKAYSYFWDFGGVTDNGSVTRHSFFNNSVVPQKVPVSLITETLYNCKDTCEMTVTVMPNPEPRFHIEEAPPYIVEQDNGKTLTLVNETPPGSWQYSWDFGDGESSAEENVLHTFKQPGNYEITLTVNNELCSQSVTKQVTIWPITPVAGFDPILPGCSPLTIKPVNTSRYDNYRETTYYWDFGDGNSSTEKEPEYTYHTAGTYKIILKVTGPGGTSSEHSQIVEVYPSPFAYFEVAPEKVLINDEKVRCFNLSTDADNYLWDFGDGDTSTLYEPYHKYMEEGVYKITLWAYSNNGCSDDYLLSPGVTVEPAGELRFGTVFIPNKNGPTTTGSGPVGEGGIEITLPQGGEQIDQYFFPPIRKKVQEYKLQIFNKWGVLIFRSDNINIPWDGYYKGKLCPQGVYVWHVEGKYADGKPFRKVGDITLLH